MGEINPDERGHGAGADGHGLLHGAAADAQEPRRIGDGERLRGGERRVFAERVTGDEGHVTRQIDAGVGFENPQRGKRDGHERRLCILSKGQPLRRPVPDDRAEPFPQRRVDFLKDLPGSGKGVGEPLAHADRLTALAGKDECRRHCCPWKAAKDTAIAVEFKEARVGPDCG